MSSNDDSFHSAVDSDDTLFSDCDSNSEPTLKEYIIDNCRQFKKCFNVCHINAQSLPKHFFEIHDTFTSSEIHAILISESWLKPSYSSFFCSLSGYVLIRNDRVGKGGGGVAIYLRSDIRYKVLAHSSTQYSESMEYLLLEITVGGAKALLGTIYSPPNISYLSELESLLFTYSLEYTHQIIMGDFNTDLLRNSQKSESFKAVMESVNFSVLPLSPTHHNITSSDSWIDFILVSSPEYVVSHGQISAPGFSRHDLIHLSYRLKPPKAPAKLLQIRNFARIDYKNLQHDASLIDWSDLYQCADINIMVNIFNDHIHELYEKHAPLHTIQIKRPPAPWITTEVRQGMNRRDRAFRKFKKYRSDENWLYYKTARNRCNQLVRAAKRRYFHNNLTNTSPANVWKFLNSQQICCSGPVELPSHISLNDLNTYFATSTTMSHSLKSKTISFLNTKHSTSCKQFNFSPIACEEVCKIVMSIKSKAVACDAVGREMIYPIIKCILPALTHLMNYSLSSGVFPSLWRKAFVIPLAKVSCPNSLNQFRPISILPFLSKILEAAVHKQVSKFVLDHNLLSDYQSGFRPGHSTTTALLKVINDCRAAMDETQVTVLVLIDFSNAFNAVDHEILLAILKLAGFSSHAREWFSSYLRGRQQAVRIGDISNWCDLSAGVPQGGILSPFLFSMFINLVTISLNCPYHLYADDLQLYTSARITDIDAAIDKINKDLQHIFNWSLNFGISVNTSKCQAILIGSTRRIAQVDLNLLNPIIFNNTTIPFSPHVKDLGLVIDSSLTWIPHITGVCQKVHHTLRILYRYKNFLPISTKITIIQTLVLPIIDYADVCYSDLSQILLDKLDRLLNNCIRFIYGLRKFDHISQYRSILKWLPIRQRRDSRMLCTLFSILYDPSVPAYLKSLFTWQSNTHNRHLRSNENLSLHVPFSRTEILNQSFSHRAIRLWNTLPADIRISPSKISFKRQIKLLFNESIK